MNWTTLLAFVLVGGASSPTREAVLAPGSNWTIENLETATQPLPPDLLQKDLDLLFRTVEESHPNVYACLTKEQYQRVMEEIRRQVARPMSLSEFYLCVGLALSCIKETHTRAEKPANFKMPLITECLRAFSARLRPLLKSDADPESDALYLPAPRKSEYTTPFSYHLLPGGHACLMVVNSFGEPNEVQQYASRFREAIEALNEKRITHLIIDLRENRGGCGLAADELLKYLAKHPFRQFESVQQRIVPQFLPCANNGG